jgi:hypothetical protein
LFKTAVVSQGVTGENQLPINVFPEKGLFKTAVVSQGVLLAKTNYP